MKTRTLASFVQCQLLETVISLRELEQLNSLKKKYLYRKFFFIVNYL